VKSCNSPAQVSSSTGRDLVAEHFLQRGATHSNNTGMIDADIKIMIATSIISAVEVLLFGN